MPKPNANTLSISINAVPATFIVNILNEKLSAGLSKLASETLGEAMFYTDRIECLFNNNGFVNGLFTANSNANPIKTLDGIAKISIEPTPLLISCLIAAASEDWEFFIDRMKEYSN